MDIPLVNYIDHNILPFTISHLHLGLLRYFLGIEVKKNEKGIFISEEKYVAEVLKRFNMQHKKAEVTPTVMGLKLSKEYCNKNVDPTLYKSIVGSQCI